MSKIIEINQAVAAVTTNDIFKKMIKANKSINKRNFLRMLNVDVKTVTPIYFNDKVYNKNKHKDCWFLFLDKEYRIMGILFENTWNKEFSQYESYKETKNRKRLTEQAYHILMITPEMQFPKKWTIKESKPKLSDEQKVINAQRKNFENLKNRLIEYKRNKYDRLLTNERAMEMIQEMLNYLTAFLFQENKISNFREKSYKAFGWHDLDIFEATRLLSQIAKELHRSIQNYEKEKSLTLFSDLEYNKILDVKVQIATAYKVIMDKNDSEL